MPQSADAACHVFRRVGAAALKLHKVGEQHAEQLMVFIAAVYDYAEHLFKAFCRRERFVLYDFHYLRFKRTGKLLDAPEEYFALVLEVDVQRSAGNSATVCNLLEGDIFVPFFCKQIK